MSEGDKDKYYRKKQSKPRETTREERTGHLKYSKDSLQLAQNRQSWVTEKPVQSTGPRRRALPEHGVHLPPLRWAT